MLELAEKLREMLVDSESLSDLKLAIAVERCPDGDRWTFRTGRPVKFRYSRNSGSSSSNVTGFDQEYEPYGRFMLSDNSEAYLHPVGNWVYGWAKFKSPLVVEHGGTRGVDGWKQRISRHFGATGKKLTAKLLRAGYDAVVTVDGGTSLEIVALRPGWRLESDDDNGHLLEARPIRVDKGEASRVAGRLIDSLEKHLRKLALRYGGEHILGNISKPIGPVLKTSVTDVLGKKHSVDVAMFSKKSSSPGWLSGGGLGKYGSGGSRGKQVITIVLNGGNTVDSFLSVLEIRLRDKIYEMLLHEFTHVADVSEPTWSDKDRKSGFRPPGDAEIDRYCNDRTEVRAYMQEIVKQATEFVGSNMDALRKIASPNRIVTWALKYSDTWNSFSSCMNDRNKKLVMKAVYTALQDSGFFESIDESWDDLSKRVLTWVDSQGDPMTLYREIVASPDRLNWNALGRFWTPDRDKADSPYGGSGDRTVVKASVRRKDVDELGTIRAMSRHPGEREIRLLPGVKVKVVGMYVAGSFIKKSKVASVGVKDFAENPR
jgi:hypothetical protein